MVTAAAIAAVGTIGGAVISGKASDKAAAAAEDAAKRSAASIEKAADRAREDVFNLFPKAQQDLLRGARAATDVFGAAIPLQQQQLTSGNIAAQQTQAQGLEQQRAALLGTGGGTGFTPQDVPFGAQFLGGTIAAGSPESRGVGAAQLGFPQFTDLGAEIAQFRQREAQAAEPQRARMTDVERSRFEEELLTEEQRLGRPAVAKPK